MRCDTCNAVITLPDGKPDPLAREGDLCDECLEAVRVADQIAAEMRQERLLDEALRRRP
jgi:hypothetical protein